MTTDIKVLFGKRLRKLRRMRDWTQEEMAEKCGMSSDFISQLERGKNSPSLDTLQKLAEVLEVPIAEFFTQPDAGK